jgi:hypothetical protein
MAFQVERGEGASTEAGLMRTASPELWEGVMGHHAHSCLEVCLGLRLWRR